MGADEYLELTIAGGRDAHSRLSGTLERVNDEVARNPSRLPGWTVGHVLTHIARNAESHVRMLRGAMAGEHLEQYAGGFEQRASDIDAGAGRPAAALVDDVRRAAAALEATWEAMTPEAWESHGLGGGTPWPCKEMPVQRWREVEVHHVDLGLGYGIEDWPQSFVAVEFRNLSDHAASRGLLAWIMGRAGPPEAGDLRPWTSGP